MLLFNKILLFVGVSLFAFCILFVAAHKNNNDDKRRFTHTKSGQQKITKVVHLMLENRVFSELFGFSSKTLNVSGLTGEEWNPVSTLDPNSPRVYVTKNGRVNFQVLDCDHSTYATTSKIYGLKGLLDKQYGTRADETMKGFVEFEYLKTRVSHKNEPNSTPFSVMDMVDPKKIPTIQQLAAEYAIFDKFHASVPGPTWPNRAFAIAATSGTPKYGNTETFFFEDGINGKLYSQKTIFDQLEDNFGADNSWRIAVGDVLWENFFEKIAMNPQNVIGMDTFKTLASQKGGLPTYTFINPPGSVNLTSNTGAADCHPAHSLTNCFNFLNDVYTAVRNSPDWNNTMFILSFDEHGGRYDPVPPPVDGVPPPFSGQVGMPDSYFRFDRLGLRIPFIVASPWIPKGTVVSDAPAAQKPFPTSQYELTSIMSTIRKVLSMDKSTNLTARDGWSSTFEHILTLDEPRTDCPQTLVPMPVDKEWSAALEANNPISDLQRDIAKSLHQLTAGNPSRKTGHYKHIKTSGEYARWSEETWNAHRHYHALHKKGVAQTNDDYSLVVAGVLDLEAIFFGEMSWNILNGTSCGIPDRWVISSRTRKDPHTNNSYCLTWNLNSSSPSFATVGVEPCYPSPDPCNNQNILQQWKLATNGFQYMPYFNPSYCMSSVANPYPENKVLLTKCSEDNILQRWMYNGLPDSLDPESNNAKLCCGQTGGELMFGNGVFSVFMKPNKLSMEDIKKISAAEKEKKLKQAMSGKI